MDEDTRTQSEPLSLAIGICRILNRPVFLPTLTNYIARQREHHVKLGFKDEVRSLLAKYEVSYDEKYIWD